MRIDTTAVHGGERPDAQDGAVNTRIVQSTTYHYPEMPDGSPSRHIYSRYDNPTVEAVEAKLAALEGCDGALGFASGMAAIQAVCMAFLRPGDALAIQRGVYGGTMAYVRDELEPMGVHVHVFDAEGPRAFPSNVRLVWMESITNPLLRVPDIEAWAHAAHDVGARLCVDATFATPVVQRPMRWGADLVMHSGTKYLGGHSDVTCGFVCHRAGDRERLWTRRRNLGATLDPLAAYLAGRGMKTLGLRMARHQENAAALAKACTKLAKVQAVHYPGLPEHPDHERARRLLTGFGGMVTIDLGSLEAAQAFRRKVRLITPAASLGGVESLLSLPVETSHAYASPESRAADGITDGLVRISVGVEDAADLVADVKAALA